MLYSRYECIDIKRNVVGRERKVPISTPMAAKTCTSLCAATELNLLNELLL
jgi:hypothetical protein